MKLARLVLGLSLLPASLTLLDCSIDASGGDGPAHSGGASASGGQVVTGSGGGGTAPMSGGSPGSSTSGTGGVSTGSGPSGGSSGFPPPGGSGGKGGGSGASGSASSGGKASGGATGGGAGGSSAGGTPSTTDACAETTPPTGAMKHPSNNASGMAAGLAWTIWSNGNGGSITTYDSQAFSAAWAESGDFLARIGLQWNASKAYTEYGTIVGQYNYKKTGSGGGYSYIGIYGWSVNPCVEFYIVDDSYKTMPVNPGNTANKGTVTIDGGEYILYTRPTTGTGGSKCGSTQMWDQYYSVRKTARTCGQISITEHFNAWDKAGMKLGKMDQAQILVEVGGGTGEVDFTVASVTASQ